MTKGNSEEGIISKLDVIDSHCHLDFAEFDGNRQQILDQCRERGMLAVIVPGVSHQRWPRLHNMSRSDPMIKAAYGLHPYFLEQHQLSQLADLPGFLAQGAIAVGEIGLDAFSGSENLPAQMELFKVQLAIAKEQHLPVIVHARKTQDLVLKAVRETQFQYGGIMHAFSGSLQQAQRLVDCGFLIGFGGAATYQRAAKLQRILKALDLGAVALETDSPDIAPAFARDQVNTPLNLFGITQILAEQLEIPVESLARQTSNNVIRLFNLDIL